MVFTFVLIFGLGKVYDAFTIPITVIFFFVLENVLFTDGMGWMGMDGWDGRSSKSIF